MDELAVLENFTTVLALVISGIPIMTACAQVGISDDTYRRWLRTSPDAIKTIRTELMEQKRLQLVEIATAKAKLITQIIEIGTSGSVGIYGKLAALGYADHELQRLEDSVGIVADADDEAAQFLNGAMPLKQMESRMTTINIQARPDGSIDLNLPIRTEVIEGTSRDDPETPDPN